MAQSSDCHIYENTKDIRSCCEDEEQPPILEPIPDHLRKKKMPRPFHMQSVEELKSVAKYYHCDKSSPPMTKSNNILKEKLDTQLNNNLSPEFVTRIGSLPSEADPPRMLWQLLPQFARKHKRKLTVILIGCVCFVMGIVIPLLIQHVQSDPPAPGSQKFHPLVPPEREARPRFQMDSVLKDLFISVKTTKKYHHPRLVILLETWVSLVKSQTWFFSDSDDPDMNARTDGHIVYTNCSDSHARVALVCKMAAEFEYFLKSMKRWWCHFDDDNYVHVTQLAHLLKSYPSDQPIYLGKPSTAKPLEIFDIKAPQNTSHFWFATGGAGFCVSRALALKMAPFAGSGKFVETGDQFWFPDDVTLGYIIEHLLGEQLTVVPEFHSHLEPMSRIRPEEIETQISFSYISYNGVQNVINLPGPFPMDADPTRFYSLHCFLYNAPFCPDT